jgi:hypothetical protein
MRPAELRTESVQVTGGRKALTVDVHCHVLTLEVEALVSSYPEKQALSTQPRGFGI